MAHILIGCVPFLLSVKGWTVALYRREYRSIADTLNAIQVTLENAPERDRETTMVVTKLEEAQLWLTKVRIR